MAQIEIKVSGRIPKYFFGVLKEKYREEIKLALQYCNLDVVETENEFLGKVLALTLEGAWGDDPAEEFYKAISEEDLKKLPKFNELINDFIAGNESHFQMIDCLFDSPDLRKYGSYNRISLFEDNALITISNYITNEIIVEETSLADFILGGQETLWAEDIEEGTIGYEDLIRLNEFRSKNVDFGFDAKSESFTWYKNKLGATFLCTELGYPELENFFSANPEEEQVTIYFDDITNWTFLVDTEGEEFDFKNLIFVDYAGAQEFRNTDSVIFSHIFYKNNHIKPVENWIRDKGITLMYGDVSGTYSLSFFLYQ